MIKIGGKIIEKGNFPDGTLLIKYEPQGNEEKIYWQFENNEEFMPCII